MFCKSCKLRALEWMEQGTFSPARFRDVLAQCPVCRERLAELSADLSHLVEQQSTVELLRPRRNPTGIVWFVAIAAVLIASLIGYLALRSHPASHPASEAAFADSRPALPSGIPALRWVAFADTGSTPNVILHDIANDRMAVVNVGSSIAGYEVRAIDRAGITLCAHMNNVELGPDSHQERWDRYFMELNACFATRWRQRTLTEEELRQVAWLAGENLYDMPQLMQTFLTDASHPLHAAAERLMAGSQQSPAALRVLLDKAEHGSPESRLQSIRALAVIHAPASRQFLRTALKNQRDPLLSVIVESLIQQGDVSVLPDLEQLAAEAAVPVEVKAAATDARLRLLETAK